VVLNPFYLVAHFIAKKIGKTWLIPEDSEKPLDKRYKQTNDLFFDHIDLYGIDQKKKNNFWNNPGEQRILRFFA
jgi:hypothetical protein